MSFVGTPAFPLLLCVLAVAVDVACRVVRRRAAVVPWWIPYVGRATRPLAALAAWNALFRYAPASFKFNPLTFPLYANLWEGPAGGWIGLALRAAVAAAAAAVVIGCLARALRSKPAANGWMIALWASLICAQLAISLVPRGWEGAVRPWTAEGKVYAWAARRVEAAGGAAAFLRDFDRIHPRMPVHARSHPPGATLLSYWTNRIDPPARCENVVRMLLMASLNVLLIYRLALEITGSRRVGVAAAGLLGSMPGASAYDTYSQDSLYSVVFLLYLYFAWRLSNRPGSPVETAFGGATLFALSLLTFGWSIAAAAGFLFTGIRLRQQGASVTETLGRAAGPPLVALALHGALWLTTGFDYFASFVASYAFHTQYYRFADVWDWTLALVGGQIELSWGVGPLAATAFLAAISRHVRDAGRHPLSLLAVTVFGCYSIPVLFGPNPLKLETARCWYWVAAVAVLIAAEELAKRHPDDDRPILLACAASLASGIGFLAFLNFGA